jgi:hypothetical protein
MENEEKTISEKGEKEDFYEKLSQLSGNLSRCHFAKDCSMELRESSVRKAEEFLEMNASEIERGILNHNGDGVIMGCLRHLMVYVIDGNKSGKEDTPPNDRKIRKDAGRKILLFLNGIRETLSTYMVEKFEIDKQGKRKYANVWEDEISSFCRMYFELAMSCSKEGLAVKSILSLTHILLPFSERAKKERASAKEGMDSGEIRRQEHLNWLSLLSGDEETIRLRVEKFLYDGEISETRNLYFPEIEEFFSSGKRWNYHRGLSAETISMHKEDYLQSGFTEEEINRAIEIFTESVGERIVKPILEEYGLSFEELARAWEKSRLRESIESNLSAIRDLEKEQPGSAKELFEGPQKIRCFGRYDTDFLLEQLDTLSHGEPYGVMCNAYEDHNGAFRNRQKIHQQIRDESARLGMKTRLMEYSDDKSSFFEQMFEMVTANDGKTLQPADYIWINQHGYSHENNPERMEQKRKEWEHIFGIGPNRSSLVIKSGGAVGSFMCFGGEEGNAMDTLAREYDISATGATKPPSNIYGVKFERDPSGRLFINVDYGYSAATPGETKIYEYDK